MQDHCVHLDDLIFILKVGTSIVGSDLLNRLDGIRNGECAVAGRCSGLQGLTSCCRSKGGSQSQVGHKSVCSQVSLDEQFNSIIFFYYESI